MSNLMDYTRYLTKEIGPRPAGTKEEQEAALYITEQFQKDAGFTAGIEEFTDSTKPDLARAILVAVTIVVTIIAMFVNTLIIPAFVVSAVALAVYIMEVLGHPLLSSILSKGTSQNVIAKYQPNPENQVASRAVTRKLILVAHYDTGRVTPPLIKRLESGKFSIALLGAIGMIAATFLLLIRIFIAISGGGALVILNVLSVVALLLCALPILKVVLVMRAPYNEGANNNATGTAALLEIARRVSSGSVSEADLAEEMSEEVIIHGEGAAQSAGLVPEGAELTYKASQSVIEEDEETRLLAAKAAIAALTGKPVERKVFSSLNGRSADPVSAEAVNHQESVGLADLTGEIPLFRDEAFDASGIAETSPAAAIDAEFAAASDAWQTSTPTSSQPQNLMPEQPQNQPAVSANPAMEVARATASAPSTGGQDIDGFQNAPSWFVAAQKNAKKSSAPATEIHRSRFTEAMENAERERFEQEQAALAAEQARRDAEMRAREEEARAALADRERIVAEHQAAKEFVEDYDEFKEGEEVMRAENEALAEGVPSAEVNQESVMDGSLDQPTQVYVMDRTPLPGFVDDASMARGVAEHLAEQRENAKENIRAEQKGAQEFVEGYDKYREETAVERSSSSAEKSGTAQPSSTSDVNVPTPAQTDSSSEPLSKADRLRSLRTNIPSLSGVIRTKTEARKAAVKSVPDVLNIPSPMDQPTSEDSIRAQELASVDSETIIRGSAPLATAAVGKVPPEVREAQAKATDVDYDMEIPNDFNPAFGGDFADNLVPDRLPLEDDEAAYDGFSEDYDEFEEKFEEPKRKSGGFFSRFRHKKDNAVQDEESMSDWLGVDENFDARSVGRARGGWESFRNDDYDDITDPFADNGYDTFDDFGTDDFDGRGKRWQGGAYSRKQLGHVNMRSGQDAEADEVLPDTPPEAEQDRFITGEIERIYHFRNPAFNTEIWFVAMGSDNDAHDGVRAFLAEHKAELRGSMVIDIESLGAGELSVASKEGSIKKVNASSRIKRYTREAVAATGVSLSEVDMSGVDSIASIIQQAGFQSMHLFGAEDGRPALKGSADDVLENVDELVFDDNVNFIYELLKR